MVVRLVALPPTHRSSHRRRWAFVALGVGVALLVAAGSVYAAVGWYAYDRLSRIDPGCGGRAFRMQTPADFRLYVGRVGADGTRSDLPVATPDVSAFRFSDYQDVAFTARGGGPTIRAWYAPGGAGATDPTVILVHGRGSCRRDPNVLLPAGMLHRAGYAVLLLDLRNHGDSDTDDGRWAGGAKEYLDVLGAWDWLVARGHPPARIGLGGTSLGAATVATALGEEPRVAGAWLDSSYASMSVAVREFAEASGYPAWVADAAIPIGRLMGATSLRTKSPDDELTRLAGRPVAIVHGLADTAVLPHHALDLAGAAARGGTTVEPWLVPGAEHTEAMYQVTDRYEAALLAFFGGAIGRP